MLLLAGGAGWVSATWRIEEIRIVGLRTVSPNLAARVAGLETGRLMLLTRLSEAEARLEGLAAVRDARVRRRLPAAVVITVAERVAIARLAANSGLAVDADGAVFERSGQNQLPVVAGAVPPRAGARARGQAAAFLRAFADFPDVLVDATSTIRAAEESSIVTRDGVEIRFGVAEELARKADIAVAILRDARRRSVRLQYVDVQAPGGPVSREVAPPTPTPAIDVR